MYHGKEMPQQIEISGSNLELSRLVTLLSYNVVGSKLKQWIELKIDIAENRFFHHKDNSHCLICQRIGNSFR